MPDPAKPTAHMYSADIKRENAYAPLIDACFYCGNKFNESAPRRGVRSRTGATLMAHIGCADRYEADGSPVKPEPETPSAFTGKNLNFDHFKAMQNFISERGPIPASVRVTIGRSLVVQEGQDAHQGD